MADLTQEEIDYLSKPQGETNEVSGELTQEEIDYLSGTATTDSQPEDIQETLSSEDIESLSEPESETSIPHSDKYVERFGTQGGISQAMDLLANAVRVGGVDSSRAKAKGGDIGDELSAFVSGAKQGYNKERYASVEDLMGEMEKAPHFLPFWGNAGTEGEFDVTDLATVPRNLLVGAAIDPLSAPTGAALGLGGKAIGALSRAGGSKLIQAANATKSVPIKDALGKVIQRQTVSKMGETARPLAQATGGLLSKLSNRQGTGIALGGLIGGQMSTKDDSTIDTLGNVAKGMAVMGTAGVLAAPLAAMGKKGTSGLVNALAKNLKGEKFSNISGWQDTVNASKDKLSGAYTDIIQDYNKQMTGIKPETRIAVAKVMEGLKTEIITRREMALASKNALLPGDKGYKLWFNNLTDNIAKDMEADGTVANAFATTSKDMADGFLAHMKVNRNMIAKVNREVHQLPSGTWDRKTGQGLVGIPWHVEDLRPLESLANLEQAMAAKTKTLSGPLKMARSLERGVSREDLGTQASRELYSKKMALNWLTAEEKKAHQMMAEYRAAPVTNTNPVIKGSAAALQAFDKATSFMKYNMLLPSINWVKNNYPDNVTRAYHQNGLFGALDAASLGVFQKGLFSDIRGLIKGDHSLVFNNPHTQDMVKLGVLDNSFFKEIDPTSETAKYFLRPEKIAEMELAAKSGNPLIKGLTKVAMSPMIPLKFIGDKIVSPIGQLTEQSARATTYIRTLNAIEKDKDLMKAIGGPEFAKRLAAKVTKDTFFDYNAVTEFERMFAKRMIPFYTFFKNNAVYYAKGMEDPRFVARVANTQRMRQEFGRPPSQEQEEGMSPYMRAGVPQFGGTTPTGRRRFMFSPSDSFLDAVSLLNPSEGNLVVEKMNPLVKGPYELLMNRDTFTQGPMYPSSIDTEGKLKEDKSLKDRDIIKNEKHLFGAGHTHLYLQKLINTVVDPGVVNDAMQVASGVYGVKLDDNNNPVATNDLQVIIDRASPLGLNSYIWPKPLLHTIAGALGKREYDKLTDRDILNNLLNTHQITTMSKGMMDYQRRTNKEIKERKNEHHYKETNP